MVSPGGTDGTRGGTAPWTGHVSSAGHSGRTLRRPPHKDAPSRLRALTTVSIMGVELGRSVPQGRAIINGALQREMKHVLCELSAVRCEVARPLALWRAMSGGGWLAEKKVLETWMAVVESAKGGAGMPAKAFGEASTVLISVFDLISGMGMAKSDMQGNATTVTNAANGSADVTLQQLVDGELDATGANHKAISTNGKTTACALLWLLRALNFILKMLQELMSSQTIELSDAVYKGYEASLKKHHGMVVRGTFNVAVKAAPYRKTFVAKLGPSEDEVFAALRPVVDEIQKMVDGLQQYLVSKNKDYFSP